MLGVSTIGVTKMLKYRKKRLPKKILNFMLALISRASTMGATTSKIFPARKDI